MDRTSDHQEDASILSSESCHSFATEDVENFTVVASNIPTTGNHLSRRRNNPDIAILAVTSPEIKALNLPITPCFPDELITHNDCLLRRRCNSGSTVSSIASLCTSPTNETTSTFSSSCSPSRDTILALGTERQVHDLEPEALNAWLQGVDDLAQQFQGFGVRSPRSSHGKMNKNHNENSYICNKENIPPYAYQKTGKTAQSQGMKMVFGRGTVNRANELVPTRHRKNLKTIPHISVRPTLHKRRSCDTLPSPDEIGTAPKLLRGASCGSIFSFNQEDAEDDVPTNVQPPRFQFPLRNHRMRPKSLSLTTGFR